MRRIVPDTQAASLEITNSKPSLDARVTYSGGEEVWRDIFCNSQIALLYGEEVGLHEDEKERRKL